MDVRINKPEIENISAEMKKYAALLKGISISGKNILSIVE
jgi:hypothetical protein